VSGLTAEERDVVATVRAFVDRGVRPVVRELEHAGTHPEALIGRMRELGVLGLAVPEPWGEAPVSMPCYALVTAEPARGWMSAAGAMGGHTVVAKLLVAFGTREQQDRRLPRMSCELAFDGYRAPADAVLGGVEGHGVAQMMTGLETGRIQVAARAVGVAQAALDDALAYAQVRESFGEGTDEIQRDVIARQPVARGGLDRRPAFPRERPTGQVSCGSVGTSSYAVEHVFEEEPA
jgi:alkylation response protein AidB-like acyl-CoA dehydrogenase